jgi:hypothetical protein
MSCGVRNSPLMLVFSIHLRSALLSRFVQAR